MDYLILLKVVSTYFIILLIMKFMGKREIGQLSLFDFVVILIIADIAVIGIESTEHPFYLYIISIAILGLIQKVIAKILLKSQKIRTIFDGDNSFIMIEGKINIKEMKKQSYNLDDLIGQLRLKNIRSLSEVRYAILETNGEMSVFKFSDFEEESSTSASSNFNSVNPARNNKSSELIDNSNNNSKDIYPFPLIVSGQINKKNLKLLKISEDWLLKSIKRKGYDEVKDIYYANYENNDLFIIETCDFE